MDRRALSVFAFALLAASCGRVDDGGSAEARLDGGADVVDAAPAAPSVLPQWKCDEPVRALARAELGAFRVAIFGDDVYWTETVDAPGPNGSRIRRTPKAGGPTTTVAAYPAGATFGAVQDEPLRVVRDDRVFWLQPDASHGLVLWASRADGSEARAVGGPIPGAAELAVGETAAYVGADGTNAIYRFALDGAAPSVAVRGGVTGPLGVSSLVVDRDAIFWTANEEIGGSVFRGCL